MAEENLLGLGEGFVYTINIVIGAGFLSIPIAFQSSGVVLSLFYLLILSIQNIYLSIMFLDLSHRAKYLKAWKIEGSNYNLGIIQSIIKNKHLVIDREYPVIENISQLNASEIFSLIFGSKFGYFFLISITISFEGALIAYVSIFASSFTSNIPLGDRNPCNIYETGLWSSCGVNYWIFLSIYAVIVIYLTFKGLKEQKSFQVTMCIMRFVIMSLIIICCFMAILREKEIDSDEELKARPALFEPTNSGKTIPIIIFALLYQLQLPSIAELIKDKGKNLTRIVALIGVVSFFSYGALGIIVPFAIDDLRSEVSINFRNYSAGYNETNFAMQFVSMVIVLFPAFDVISCFPLSSISLADNWKEMLYGKNEVPKSRDNLIKGLISVFPVIIAFFTYDLGKILNIAGLLPLLNFNIVVPLAYIPMKAFCNFPSPFNLKYYNKNLNLLIALFNFSLLIYSLVKTLSD